MRLITWNCQQAYRKKAAQILPLKPDIVIVPECESPKKQPAVIRNATSYYWYGHNLNKGIGVFAYTDYEINLLDEPDDSARYCIPLEIISPQLTFNLIAIWAMDDPNRRLSYIGQVYLGIQRYLALINRAPTLLIGDWNANKIWDSKYKIANFSGTAQFLSEIGIYSAYHTYFNEPYGEESQPTFYMYRKEDKPYHIDYCFLPELWAKNLKSVHVGKYADWRSYSDHSPVIIDIDIDKLKNN